ncbi:MAG: succinate dehydrogenase [Desulfobulbus propionicus]|nr:MAG: succinate dehydrogenase [Desulfobulbus propionicus]
MYWFIEMCRSSLGKKYIMAITGLMLIGFLVVHTIGNSTIFWGRGAFNSYAHHLHSLGIFVPLFELALLSIFLLHVITGITLFIQNLQARGNRYEINKEAGGRTWGSSTMPYTGAAILVFILIHLGNVHFTDHSIAISDIVTSILNHPGYTLVYGAAMALLLLHISHGCWSLFQTLGISHPKYDGLIRVATRALAGIICGVFLLITLLLLFSQDHLM